MNWIKGKEGKSEGKAFQFLLIFGLRQLIVCNGVGSELQLTDKYD
jgi:hypothetical protein